MFYIIVLRHPNNPLVISMKWLQFANCFRAAGGKAINSVPGFTARNDDDSAIKRLKIIDHWWANGNLNICGLTLKWWYLDMMVILTGALPKSDWNPFWLRYFTLAEGLSFQVCMALLCAEHHGMVSPQSGFFSWKKEESPEFANDNCWEVA